MSIIASVRDYLMGYESLDNRPVWVNYLGAIPIEYSIVPLTGTLIIETYLNGRTLREFTFAFQSVESTADNIERLETLGFYEAFAYWLEAQSNGGELPILGDGRQAVEIEALGWAYLFRQGESDTGIYQIQCRLEYEEDEIVAAVIETEV